MSKALPKVIQMMMRCSRSPLWRNTAGLCEVQSRVYVVNHWKYDPDHNIFLFLSLCEVVIVPACRVLASFKHTPHQKHGMSQSVTKAGESQRAFDYPAVKLVVWSSNIWIRNERVGQRGLCCLQSLDSLLGMEMKIAEWRLGFGSPSGHMDSEELDYSARIK